MQGLNALPHVLALQRVPCLLRNQFEQALCARGGNIRKADCLDDKTFIRGHSTGRSGRLGGLERRRIWCGGWSSGGGLHNRSLRLCSGTEGGREKQCRQGCPNRPL